MGHIKDLRKRKQGYKGDTPYWARTYDPEGKEISQCFAEEEEAGLWLAEQELTQARGTWVDPREGRITFQEYAENWRKVRIQNHGTAVAVESRLRCQVYPRIGTMELNAIRQGDIQAMCTAMAATLAPATVAVAYSYVASIFLHAIANKILTETPCTAVALPRDDVDEIEPLLYEEVEAIAALMPPRLEAMVWAGAGLGLRQGELLGLTVDRIDLRRDQVKVNRQMITPSGLTDEQKAEIAQLTAAGNKPPRGTYTQPHFGPPKTRASRRTVPLPELVKARLLTHLEAFPPATTGTFAGLVFTHPDALSPIRRQRIAEVWKAAATAAGVDKSFHSLRHFYASLLIEAGESVVVVQKRLGHATATETLETYAHLWPESDTKTRLIIDQQFRPRPRLRVVRDDDGDSRVGVSV